MLIEAAKGGHTAVVNLLLDWPNTAISPTPDLTQLTPPDSQVITNEVCRHSLHTSCMCSWLKVFSFKAIVLAKKY